MPFYGSPTRVQFLGLLRAGARSFWNSCWRSGAGRRVATVVAPLVGVALWSAMTPFAVTLWRADGLARGDSLFSLVATVMVVLVAFTMATSVSFALASIYFAKDVEWLMHTPIGPRLFLSYRLLAQFLLGAAIGTVVAGPAVLGLAIATGRWWLVPLVAVVVAALLLPAMSTALMCVVALVRVVPATRVKDAAGVLVALVGFGVAAVDIAAAVGSGSGVGVSTFAHGIRSPSWAPWSWAAASITDSAHGRLGPALLLAAVLVTLAAIVTILAIEVSGPLLRDGWFRSQSTGRRRRQARSSFLPLPVSLSVLRKDWRTLRRDPAQLIQLLLPIGVFAIYLLSPRAGGLGLGAFHHFPVWYGPLTTAAFAALFAASGLGLRAVGSEGRQFWCLKTAPVSTVALLLSKLLLPAIVTVSASLALMVSTELRVGTSVSQVLFSSVLLVVCVLGLSCLATGLGAVWPRLDWSDPRRSVGVWLAILFMVVGAAYVAICVVGLTLALLITGQPNALSALLAILVCVMVAGATSLAALRAGHRRLVALDA